MSYLRAVMCGDCIKFNMKDCPRKGKVKKTQWKILLPKSNCENFKSNSRNGKCLLCGSTISKDKVRCRCTFDGEYMD